MNSEYFVWNLPLFKAKDEIEKCLRTRIGDLKADFWKPTKSKHRDHGGCVRVVCGTKLQEGELDIGYRYPVFVKNWQTRSSGRAYKKREELDDAKSNESDYDCDSQLRISSCCSVNIVETVLRVEICESVSIASTIECLSKASGKKSLEKRIVFEELNDIDLKNEGHRLDEITLDGINIESGFMDIQAKLHDYEIIKGYMELLRAQLRPYHPHESVIVGSIVEGLKITARKCWNST